jgi:hypothetical protein
MNWLSDYQHLKNYAPLSYLAVCESVNQIVCDDGRWIEVDHDHAQWRALASVVLTFRFCYELSVT